MTNPQPTLDSLALGTRQMCVDVIEGVKKISVRTGHRPYRENTTLKLYNEEHGFKATATIGSVRHCTLGEVTEQEWLDDGFASQQDLLDGLRQFYGDSITLDSDVTVLRWYNASG